MRKWLFLGCALVAQSLVFLACGNTDGLETPMIADCDGCALDVSGGGTSSGGGESPDAGAFDDAVIGQPDAGTFVDVGVSGNDVFGDTTGFVDVGASNSDGFPFF